MLCFSRLPIRGGNWNNGANAGVFYTNLNNPRSNSNNNVGFRSALPCILAKYCILRDQDHNAG
nr:MAG TPA: TREPONEMA DENTICOLA VARIABLE PROTEIN 1 FUNCTION, PERIODONTAL DISEASE [Caudoviricetes sp.]